MSVTDKRLVLLTHYGDRPLSAIGEWALANGYSIEQISITPVETKDFLSKKDLLWDFCKAIFKWGAKAEIFRNKKLYCTGGQIPAMAICKIFGKVLGDYHLYIHNFYIHNLGNNTAVKKILSFLLSNPRLTIIAQSQGEINYFRSLSSRPEIEFLPYCSDLQPTKLPNPTEYNLPDEYIFTGGYTNRDYNLMVRLAERFPHENFVFITSSLNKLSIPENIKNITLLRNLPKSHFETILANSKIVVVPLKEDVGASGQMLSLSALRNGKPTVYTDLSVINYYFSDGAGIGVPINNLEAMSSALDSLLNDTELMKKTGEKAGLNGEGYTLAFQNEKLIDILGL